jgi:hypothetical protein
MKPLALLLAAASLSSATTYYVTVAGLGGEQEFQQRFEGWAKEIDGLVKAQSDAQVRTLYGADATRAKLESTLRAIAAEAKHDDALVFMLIGHGTFDGTDYKFNLPGPDVTASQLSELLDRIPAARQLVVNMTSCSGSSLKTLRHPGRVVVTATKTGTERNATIFARYWVEALRDPAADSDKNETVSALEAYKYAEQKTAQFYESQKRLATEHALLEDTGNGDGVRQPSPQNGEGLAAAQFALVRMSATQNLSKDPAKLTLLKQRESLEAKIDQLKYEKASLSEEEYKKQLRDLVTQLAKVQAELDK